MIVVTLKSYLASLEEQERMKPLSDRRIVPTLADISKNTGLHYTGLSRFANHHTSRVHFDTADAIIKAVRDYGFSMTLCDLLQFREDNL